MATQRSVPAEELSRLLGPQAHLGPAYAEIASGVRALILDGRIALRARLPSERRLAFALRVSRTTATAAYDVLREEGFLESRQGSGSTVALPTGGAVDRELGGQTREHADEGIDLTAAALPAPGAMMEAVDLAARDLAGYLGGSGYDPAGLRSLRAAVARDFASRGMPTDPEQIVITSGAQHAVALLLSVLLAPGDRALVEVPSYPNALEALRRAGASLVTAPMSETWNVRKISSLLRSMRPRLAYLIPDFHNPTGALMTDADRAALVTAAARVGTHLVVDETFAGLNLEKRSRMPQPMGAHDRDAVVVTLGSMSKAYWGGLRIGWIRCAVPLARQLARARSALDLATPVLEQLIAQHLLAASRAVLAERRSMLIARRAALVNALQAEVPHWRFATPRGGLCLWVDLAGLHTQDLAEAAAHDGVRLVPGTVFGVDGEPSDRVRVPFTQPPELLEEAARRLAAADARCRAIPTTNRVAPR
ncbi:MAG: PLP-dependent aminotransferase family protein [Actinomycetota bacterium]